MLLKKVLLIPYDNTKTYHTLNDFQEEFEIEVFEGENIFVKDNNLQGKFRIKNLPKKKAQEVEFDVNFKIDTNGILTVTAQLKEKKKIFIFFIISFSIKYYFYNNFKKLKEIHIDKNKDKNQKILEYDKEN